VHIKDLLASRTAIQAAMYLARRLSPAGARRVTALVAGAITLPRGTMYRYLLGNQAHVRALQADDPRLHQAVRAVLMHTGQVYYDLFQHAARDLPMPIDVDEQSMQHLQQAAASGRGAIVGGAHLGGFDFALSKVSGIIPMQILSLTEPPKGFRLLNDLRATPPSEITPIGPATLRAAIRRLRSGGVLATGIDRPVPGQLEDITFFGAPAHLPVGHIRLALRTGALLLTFWCEWTPERGYRGFITEPMELLRSEDEQADLITNARRMLVVAEAAIARHPDQWLMYVPVWGNHQPGSQRRRRQGVPI
jgi:lauroyl/myristoyl acyltransferase